MKTTGFRSQTGTLATHTRTHYSHLYKNVLWLVSSYKMGAIMRKYDIDRIFSQITAQVEEEFERKKSDAFVPETRPIPEGLIQQGIPLGHIALRGDFQPVKNLGHKPDTTPKE